MKKRMISRRLALAVAAIGMAGGSAAVRADICKYLDADGRTIYSNLPVKGAKRLSCDHVLDLSPGAKGARSTPSPQGFPKVDTGTQKNRDDRRRQILAEELAGEEKLLAEAQANYRNGAPERLPEEAGNDAKFRDRVAKLKQTVALHEKNVEALKHEMAR
jgi:hypothetical protein